MKKLSFIALIAALLCGVSIYSFLNARSDTGKNEVQVQEIKTTALVTAVQEIPPHTPITAEMLQLTDFPEEYAPAEAARGFEELLGLESDGTIFPGELIFIGSVGTAEETGGCLSYRIPDGKRAMTVSVGTGSGVGGYLSAGDLVDVLQYIITEEPDMMTSKQGTGREVPGGITHTALEAVEILAVGSNGYDGSDGSLYDSVTLALTPEQCSILTAIQCMPNSYISLALRQKDDAKSPSYGTETFTEQAG